MLAIVSIITGNMLLLRGTLVFLLTVNASVDASEKPAISANKTQKYFHQTLFKPMAAIVTIIIAFYTMLQ